MWFLYALIALLCWSGSDLFSKKGSRPEDTYSHWKMVMAVGVVMGLQAGYEIVFNQVAITFHDILQYLPASAMYILSMIIGYVGLRYIELSISSPICNSSGAVAAILCFIFLGQRLQPLQVVAVILVCAGVLGLGIVERRENEAARQKRREAADVRYRKSFLAILFPVLYCIIDALGTFADSVILETMDETKANVSYELTFLFMAVVAFIYVVVIKKQRIFLRNEKSKMAAGVFETAGQLFYIPAIALNAVAAAPMISSYCVVSVLWSRIFLREKLSWKHYAVIFITVAGIAMLGFFDA